ncbi:MAG: M23 family metallopeptidase [Spirochaetia bacterium]|nr:M23 family metallopeptidase [Spirochaetia bacterium]
MKKYIKKVWKKVNNRGHERITFMVIPHGEATIVSIQLSKFTIYFALFITISVLFASVVSMQLQESIRPEVDQLNDSNRTYYYEREQYVDKFKELQKYQQKLKNKLNSLFEMANMSEADVDIFLDENILRKNAASDMQTESDQFSVHMIAMLNEYNKKKKAGNGSNENIKGVDSQLLQEFSQVYSQQKSFKYSSEVVSYRELYLDIKQTEYILSIFENFLEERDIVQKNLPYYWPLAGGHFTSFYGPRFSPFGYSSEFHLGVDMADRIGTPVYASAEGRVIHAVYDNSGYGRNVLIQHKFGYTTLYAHLNSVSVYAGQYVSKGQNIGTLGETGRATGPHLHFEVRIDGKHINPLPYLTSL